MKSDRKRTILFIIILLVLSMGIGYAFLTTTLTIDGVSDIDSSSWDVHFENVQVQSGSVTGSQVITPATIGSDNISVSYHIKLNEPGDNYIFKIDAVNDGSLDAMIDNIIFQINGVDAYQFPDYLAGYVMYDGYESTSIGDILEAGDTKTFIVGIHYREDIDPEDLPDEDQSLTISFGIVYTQAGKASYLYTTDSAYVLSGESVPDEINTYDNYSSAVSAFGHNVFVRLLVRNNRVYEKAVGFIYNNNVYYIVGGDNGASFESNQTVLDSAFGSNNCELSQPGPHYHCDMGIMNPSVYTYGKVSAVDNGVQGCSVFFEGFECGDLSN